MTTGDRRSTLCKKWVVIEDRRTPCSFFRAHEGPCSWDVIYPSDDSAIRDVGPFQGPDQVMEQFARWSAGMPISQTAAALMLMMEGALLAGLVPTEFERDYIVEHGVDPVLATILSGWLIRTASLKRRAVVRPVDPGSV